MALCLAKYLSRHCFFFRPNIEQFTVGKSFWGCKQLQIRAVFFFVICCCFFFIFSDHMWKKIINLTIACCFYNNTNSNKTKRRIRRSILCNIAMVITKTSWCSFICVWYACVGVWVYVCVSKVKFHFVKVSHFNILNSFIEEKKYNMQHA